MSSAWLLQGTGHFRAQHVPHTRAALWWPPLAGAMTGAGCHSCLKLLPLPIGAMHMRLVGLHMLL